MWMMRNLLRISLIAGILFLGISSCDVLQEVLDTANTVADTPAKLSTEEVVRGLKEALNNGTQTAAKKLSATNGYFGDQAVKILLPPQAKIIMDNKDNTALKAIGITKMIDDVILRMNRSAENAATQAVPIFAKAITDMSLQDAWGILKGNDTAATHYFRQHTTSQLQQAFRPIMSQSLNKKLVGGVSANEAWNKLAKAYNKVAAFSASLKTVNADLTNYATSKAVDGVFKKIALQEKAIRTNPMERTTDLLKRVFDKANW